LGIAKPLKFATLAPSVAFSISPGNYQPLSCLQVAAGTARQQLAFFTVKLELGGGAWSDAMNRNILRTRLRDINIEHSRLVKDKSALDRFARIAALRSERAILLGLLAGDSTLRLVSSRNALPAPHRQSA